MRSALTILCVALFVCSCQPTKQPAMHPPQQRGVHIRYDSATHKLYALDKDSVWVEVELIM